MQDSRFSDFLLAGGTNLALRLGHRKSVDLAMKLVAISDNGKRLKDFVDIAFLSTQMSLNKMLEAYTMKYKGSNALHAVRGLAYFDDINFDVSIDLINSTFHWKKIEKRIRAMIKYEDRIFEDAP